MSEATVSDELSEALHCYSLGTAALVTATDAQIRETMEANKRASENLARAIRDELKRVIQDEIAPDIQSVNFADHG